MAKRLTLYIFIGLALGLLVGWAINAAMADGTVATQERLATIAGHFSVVSTLFLRLIKMIIAPLVFATLVSGIIHMADTSALGRIGGRALAW
ncbi:MAG: cation:dicarboxylate symporter family transporter, partial [Sphingopyxis sp.]